MSLSPEQVVEVYTTLSRWAVQARHTKVGVTYSHNEDEGRPEVRLEWVVGGLKHALTGTADSHEEALRGLLLIAGAYR
jgi:hypothetical protein